MESWVPGALMASGYQVMIDPSRACRAFQQAPVPLHTGKAVKECSRKEKTAAQTGGMKRKSQNGLKIKDKKEEKDGERGPKPRLNK